MDWRWILLGVGWVYGLGVNVFGTLPALTEWYCGNDPDPTKWCDGVTLPSPDTISWLYLIAVVAHTVIFGINAFVWNPRSMFTWHHGFSIFAYAWPTIAALVWNGVVGILGDGAPTFDITSEASLRGYILWKVVLMLGFVAAILSTSSAVDLIRSHFKHRKYQPRT